MRKTHPLRSGHYFRYDEKEVQTGLAGQQYYPAEKVYMDNRGKEKLVDPEEKYVLVECCDVWNDETVFRRWMDRMSEREWSMQVPELFLCPVMTLSMPGGNAAWIGRCSRAPADCLLVTKKTTIKDAALFAEAYCYATAMAEDYSLRITNLFYSESGGTIMMDTSPSMLTQERHGLEWLRLYLQSKAPHLVRYIQGGDCWRTYHAFQSLNDSRRELQGADEKTEPVAVEMNLVLTRRRGILPMSQPKVSRTRYLATLNRPMIQLSGIFPDLSQAQQMEIMAEKESGLLSMINRMDSDWRCSRLGGMSVKPDYKIQLRVGDEFSMTLDKGTTLSVSIRRFETRRIRKKQAEPTAMASVHPTQDSAALTPVRSNVNQTVALTSERAKMPFEDRYDYYRDEFPKPGGSIAAAERETGKRVRIDVHAANADSLEQLRLQKAEPLPPMDGFCGLRDVYVSRTDDSFFVVREEPDLREYVQVGSPKLNKWENRQLYAIGAAMMERLAHAARHGWIPAKFYENSLLIHPDTQAVLFADGAYLSRPDKLPFECTLGYASSALGEAGGLACEVALSYASAVWLYRLLVGGYPLEGAQSRAIVRDLGTGEESVLTDMNIPFVFDPSDRRNSIEGLGASFDRQIARYKVLDERIKQNFERIFGEPANSLREAWYTPGQWAALLQECAQGG